MSRFANAPVAPPPAPQGVVVTLSADPSTPDTRTYEGGAGWTRDPKSELYLLAVANMVSNDTYYEDGKSRDARFESLIAQVAAEDPDWIARMIPWLRLEANMRSASIVMAAELVRARLASKNAKGTISNTAIIDSAIQRADEPAEMIGYWRSRYGRQLPMPVKRGVAKAAVRLFNENSYIKYGSAAKGLSMADVIDIVHPEPKAPWQSALFKLMLDERHDHVKPWAGEESPYAALVKVAGNRAALALEQAEFVNLFDPEKGGTAFVEANGFTWEQATSKYGKLDAKFWASMIPSMGIFALVRNLRNMDDVGLGSETGALVEAKLKDPDVIAKSRMFPLRFYSAYREVASTRWTTALEAALDHATSNIPELSGNSLVLIDVSGSMAATLSAKSKVERYMAAAVFGAAVARRTERVTLVPFGSTSEEIEVRKGASALRLAEAVANVQKRGHLGYGTETFPAITKHFKPGHHDRILVFTDEQAFDSSLRGHVEKITVPIYTFNLAGYKAAQLPTGGKRYAFGGLSDAAFTAIKLLERGEDEVWPF